MARNELDDDELALRKRFWRRVRRFVLYPLLCLVVIIGGIVGWLSARDASARGVVNQKIEALREQGLPFDNESLANYHDRMSETRDLDQWLQLLNDISLEAFVQESREVYPTNDEAVPAGDGTWPAQATTQAFLSRWQTLLQTAQRLAQADIKRRMPVVIDGINTDLKWSDKIHLLARLFQTQAIDAIFRRDSAATRDAILNLLGTARAVEGQPLIISQITAIAVEGTAIQHLQQAIEANVLNADDLQRVMDRLNKRTAWQEVWKVGINSDRAAMLPVFNEPARYLGNQEEWRFKPPWRGHDTLSFLEITQEYLDTPQGDLTEFRDANRKLDVELDRRFRGASFGKSFDNLLCMFLLPAYGSYAEAIVQREMRARLSILAIGTRLYERKYDRLPEKLSELNDVGVDPVQHLPPGGKPFGFRKLEASVALWGFQSRNNELTPDEPPDITSPDHQWDRMWLWQLER